MSKVTLPDDYEKEHMRAGDAIARERVGNAWWGNAIFLAAFALCAVSLIAHPLSVATWLGPIVLAATWFLLMNLRVVVTRDHLHVQLGLFGPKIPIAAIEKVEEERPGMRGGGWGIRRGLDGVWTYSVPAWKGYVKVTYREGESRTMAMRFMSGDPHRMASAILEARSRVRIGAEPRVAADPIEEEAAREVEEELKKGGA